MVWSGILNASSGLVLWNSRRAFKLKDRFLDLYFEYCCVGDSRLEIGWILLAKPVVWMIFIIQIQVYQSKTLRDF